MPGDLNVKWIHGAPDCATAAEPPIQVHAYDQDTFILRQGKCSDPGTVRHPGPSFEAPFLYLLIGNDRALLFDTGATHSPARFPIGEAVRGLLRRWGEARHRDGPPLVVCHSHSHGDHIAGDRQFAGRPGATVVATGVSPVCAFFGITRWPDQVVTFDLGGRTLDVIPVPGHEAAHIALYDRESRFLLTGDTLYPGLLVVNDWGAYRKSVARLKAFADDHEVVAVLGAHIEMKASPGKWFGLRKLYQPGEHALPLLTRHVSELNDALQAMGDRPRVERHADFIIFPARNPLPNPDP